jgi:GAF domain-containing protein
MEAAVGASSEAFLQMRLAVGTGVGGIAVREGRAISVPDYDAYVQTTPDSVRDALREESVVSVLCAPMIHRGGMVGALYVGSRELTEFRGIATSLLSAMAAQAAVAIRNARLYQEVVQKHEELERSFAVHRTLTDASLVGVGLQAVLVELAGLVGRDVWLDRAFGSPARVVSSETEEPRSGRAGSLEIAVNAGEDRLGTLGVNVDEPLDWRLQADLLEELLQAGDALSAQLRARARKAGVDLDRARYVAIVDAGDEQHAAQPLHMVQSVGGAALALIRC